MLIPKKVKHRKWQKGRGRNKRTASTKIELAFGSYGLKAITPTYISSRQIEAGRRVITRYIRKQGKMWIRIFPDRPITKKGNEIPMGSGKGAVDHYVAVVRPGTIIYEMDGVTESVAKEALLNAAHKMSAICKFVSKT